MTGTLKRKVVEIHYYAQLREERGLSNESVSTGAHTARELYEELKEKHGLTIPINRLNLAINNQFSNWETLINAGDVIVFIPPVAGG